MAQEENKKQVWLNSAVSPMLTGKEELTDYGKKVQELRAVAETLAPAGRLVIFLSSEKEKYFKFEKLVSNLAISKNIYNERGFMADPTLAEEFSAIAEHINAINSIIDKRKQKNNKKRRGGTHDKRNGKSDERK